MTWSTIMLSGKLSGNPTSTVAPKPKPKPKAKPKAKPNTEKEQRNRLSLLRESFSGNANTKMTVQTLIGSHFCLPEKKKDDEPLPCREASTPTPTPTPI